MIITLALLSRQFFLVEPHWFSFPQFSPQNLVAALIIVLHLFANGISQSEDSDNSLMTEEMNKSTRSTNFEQAAHLFSCFPLYIS